MTDGQYMVQFKKPDKMGAIALMAVAGAVIGYVLYLTLPTLIELAQNTIYFGVELIVGVTLAMIFLNKSTWVTIHYAIANQLRKVRRAIVHEDPIGVLTTVINRFNNRLVEIDEALVQSDAAIKRQQKGITTAQQKSTNETNLAESARASGLPEVTVTQHVMAAERWTKSADSMQPQAELLDRMQTALEQARDLCAARLEDFKSQKQTKALELDIAQSNKAVASRFKKFFGSNPELEMQDMALEEIERQTSEADAEIDQLMRVVNPMLADADLKKQAEAQQAMAKFNKFTTKALPTGASVVDGVVVKEKEMVKK